MSRRLAVCALSLAVASAIIVPTSASAQVGRGSGAFSEGVSWLSALWSQVLDKIVPLSEAGIQIDGNGIAAQAGIQIDGNGIKSDAGIQIDGNGRPTPGYQESN